MNPRDVVLATFPPALWAVTYVLAKPATAHFPPLLLVAMVFGIVGAVRSRPWRWRTSFPILLVCAVFGGSLQSALIFTGISMVPASLAILVVQSQVPFAVVAAWLVGQEELNIRRLAGIAVSLLGVAIVVGIPASTGETWGLLLIVLGTASWGFSQGIIRARSKESGGDLIGAITLIASPQVFIASMFIESGQIHAVSTASLQEWIMVIALAVGGYLLPYTIWYDMLRRYRVDQIAPFILLMPIVGVAAGTAFLGDRITSQSLVGGTLILAGLALVVGVRAGTTITRTSEQND